MQAIEVKYYGTTNTKPSRLRAECSGGKMWASFDYEYNDGGAERLAYALAEKLGWGKLTFQRGTIKNGNDVFVIVRDEA